MAQGKIIQAKGIRVSTPGGDAVKAYGGYPYSVQYSINFTSPSKMTVSFVSEDGEYNEKGLKQRIFPAPENPTISQGGAITTDTITFGTEKFNMHPMRYTIQDGPSGRFLTIDYYDKSIILDKIIVALKGKHYPPIHYPSYLRNFGVAANLINEDRTFTGGVPKSPWIIGVGNPYLPKHVQKHTGVLPKSERDKISDYIVPEYLYSPYELYLGIIYNPMLAGMLSPSVQLLWWLGKHAVQGSNGLNWAAATADGGGVGDPDAAYLKNYSGTLRSVLDQWARVFGFLFYWESEQGVDKLGMMDLRNGNAFSNITDSVERFIGTAKVDVQGLVNVSHAYSIEDTFSQGAAGYLGMDGKENAIPYKTSFKPLDLITLPLWSCNTKSPFDTPAIQKSNAGCEIELVETDGSEGTKLEDDAKRFILSDFCQDNDGKYKRPYASIKMNEIRSAYRATLSAGGKDIEGEKVMSSYIRLLKAAMIGPEFFRAFVLLKKAASSYEDKPFTSSPLYRGIDKNQINNYGFDVNQTPMGESFLPLNVDKDKKQIVNLFYTSGGLPDSEYENNLKYYNSLCYMDPNDHVDSSLPFKTAPLEAANQLSSLNYTIGRDCISIQRVNSKQFESLLFADDRIRQNLGISRTVDSGKPTDFDPLDDTGHLAVYRIKKYGNTQLVQNPAEDHIYKLLNGIATNQGRFYYHPAIIKQETFSKRNYINKNIQWIHRHLCANDSPFSGLQDVIDPVSDFRKKPMPNACVQDKARASLQRDAKNKPFAQDNLANLTVEQFIDHVYAEKITGVAPISKAILVVATIAGNGGVTRIDIIDGGDGYKDGVLSVAVTGKNKFEAEATATVEDGVVTGITIDFAGEGYSVKDVAAEIDDPTATGKEHNVFGAEIDCTKSPTSGKVLKEGEGVKCRDCITSGNLTFRDEQYRNGLSPKKVRGKKVCTPPDLGGVLLKDVGQNFLSIPANIQALIEKYSKGFYILPATFPLDLVRFHNESNLQLVVLPQVGSPPPERLNVEVDDPFQPVDELDWLVDQVSVPNLDMIMVQTKERKKGTRNSWFGKSKVEDKKVRNKDLIALEETWLGQGPKFEQSCLIEPIFTSNVAGMKFVEVEPSQEDLGVKEAECLTVKQRAAKIKKDQKKIKQNMRDYVEAHAYHEGDFQFNAKLSVMGNGLLDKDGGRITLSILDGLEGVSAQLDGDGVVFEYTLGTKRKRRILETPNSDQWVKVKPEFFNNVFDI
jgi:hypothetical protein